MHESTVNTLLFKCLGSVSFLFFAYIFKEVSYAYDNVIDQKYSKEREKKKVMS